MPLNNEQTVSPGEHELSNLLGAWGKADSPSNREALAAEANKFRDDPDWGPHTWERFYQYVAVRSVKKLLTDKAFTAARHDDAIGAGYTVIDGWGPPEPKLPAPPEKKREPAPSFKPSSSFIVEPEPVKQPAPPREPSPVFSAASQPPPAPPKSETAPPREEPFTVPSGQKPPSPPGPKTPPPSESTPPPKETTPGFPQYKPTPLPAEPAPPQFKPAPTPPPETSERTRLTEATRTDAAPEAERRPPEFTRTGTPPEETSEEILEETMARDEIETRIEEAPERKRKSLVPVILAVLAGIAVGAIILIIALTRPASENTTASPGPVASASPAASASVSPVPSPATVAERFIRTVGENTPIMFIADEETFLPGERRKLDNILAAAKGLRSADLSITGHTADNNLPHAQFVLSLERAQAVRDYLLKNPAGSVFTIQVRGRGALEPVVTGVPLSEQAANRRAEITVRDAR